MAKKKAEKKEPEIHDRLMELHEAISDEAIVEESDLIKPHLVSIRSKVESYVQAQEQELA